MKKFLVLYKASAEAQKSMHEKMANGSSEDMKAMMGAWFAWEKQMGDNLIDFGNPLMPGKQVSASGAESVSTEVIGYSLIQADNLDTAVELLKNHPHSGTDAGCNIEVQECQNMPSM